MVKTITENKIMDPKMPSQNDSTITVLDGAIVPPDNVYYVETTEGKVIATFKGGQEVELGSLTELVPRAGEIDCVEITCPGGFGSQVTCWRCRARPQ